MAVDGQLARLLTSGSDDDGCAAWNLWRKENLKVTIDLSLSDLWHAHLAGANLSGALLSHVDFGYANLMDANFTNATLRDVDFIGANLRNTNFTRSKLETVAFNSANLYEANFRVANLNRAVFMNTQLEGVDFSNASISSTSLSNVDLRQVTGLATMIHTGPSTIGSDTFYQSQGEIPDSFLRGCGLPDEMIGFVHSIAGSLQYYSVFISYNHHDEAFATRLYNDLQANNVRCWKYTEDQKIGARINYGVDEAIRLHDKLLVILSESSLASKWVEHEVEMALEREDREHIDILFPVKVDDAIVAFSADWANKIRGHRHIGDFTTWKDQEQYQPMFERLLRDLKAGSR